MSAPKPTREVHVARKEYPCDSPYRHCDRRIRRGDAYTMITFPPGSEPLRASIWTTVRACSACEKIPHEVVPREKLPCTIGRGEDLQCELTAGHVPPCQYPIGLF